MDMERQIAQFYLQKPGGNRAGDPIATALSNIASGLVTGVKMDSELKTAALNRELAQAREDRAKETMEVARQEREEAKKDKEDAKRQERLDKMTGDSEKANANADGIAEYMISQPEFGGMNPEMVIEASIAAAASGKTVIDIQDALERQRQNQQRAEAAGTTAEASSKRAETGEAKRVDVAGGAGGSGVKESEASITNRGQANAADTVGRWEAEKGGKIELVEVELLRDQTRMILESTEDETERKVLLAEIEAYESMMMKTDLDRSAGPARDTRTRGKL